MLDDILYHIAYSLAFAFLRIPNPHRLITNGSRSWEFGYAEGLGGKNNVKVTVEIVGKEIAFAETETYAGVVSVPSN